SLVAEKKGAIVTATDVSKKAIENITLNKRSTNAAFEIIHSDLFQNIPRKMFDVIVINPPYYKGKILNDSQYAWYAGEHLEYFQKLFAQLSPYMHVKSNVMMILSDECDIKGIQSIAAGCQMKFHQVLAKKKFMETNFIFELKKDTG